MIKHKVARKNCRKLNSGNENVQPAKVYIPPSPTWMTDGRPLSSYRVNMSEVQQGYRGSAYEITKRKHVD